jgi:nicotinamidase-related amidase
MTPPLDRARGFGGRLGFGSEPAILVIDMIVGFTDPDLPLGAPMHRELSATRELLDAARERQVPILFSSVYYEGDGIWGKKIETLGSIQRGSPEGEVDRALGRRPDEPVVLKKYASVFFGTDLLSRLNGARIDTLLIAGCTTSGCVRATAVDTVSHAIRPIIVREAVADRSAPAHEQSLIDLDDKYADVVSLDEACAYVAAVESTQPREA